MLQRLTPQQSQILLEELKINVAKQYGLKKATNGTLASYLQCSEPAVSQWKKRGIGKVRLQNLYLSFPYLKFWTTL